MKTKIMPFWFVDIISTEKKLSAFAEKGLALKDFSPVTGKFTFEETDSTKAVYRICLSKGCMGKCPKGLAESGWEQVCGNGDFYAVRCTDQNPVKVPSYKSWKTLNRVTMLVCFFLFSFAVGFMAGAANDAGSPAKMAQMITHDPVLTAALIMSVISIILFIIGAASNSKLKKTDTDLEFADTFLKTVPKENFTYNAFDEDKMLKEGTMIRKYRYAWTYAPDKTEEWVEKMAAEGWRFYRFDTTGNCFYFVKSEPVKLKFVADYQNEATDEYFTSCKDDGWHLEFTSIMRVMSFVIWSKEYEGDTPPEFYSDPESKLRHAKRLALTIGIPTAAVLICAVSIVIDNLFFSPPEEADISLAVGYLTFSVIYSIIGGNSVGYYIRTRKKYKCKK